MPPGVASRCFMEGSLATLTTAVAVFAATNIDDIVLLSVLFADPHLRPRNVVAGQFVGITALVVVSAMAALLAVAIRPGWTALLGLVPLGLGIYQIVGLFRKTRSDPERSPEVPQNTSQVLAVASITIANGGDNIGVYVPLFASNRSVLALYAPVFAVMTGLWCVAGYFLVNNPVFGTRMRRYGRVALPFVLIGLGIHILWGARALLH
jgi:cadmium resistance protein CadD (predicted permease)